MEDLKIMFKFQSWYWCSDSQIQICGKKQYIHFSNKVYKSIITKFQIKYVEVLLQNFK